MGTLGFPVDVGYTVDRMDAENVTCFGSVRRLCAENIELDFLVLHLTYIAKRRAI
jgi:hypothetical protein